MEKISWSDRMRNEEVWHTVKKERNFLRAINEGRLIVLVKSCVGTVFQNTLLRES
jgi:hypothetical protein